MKEPFNDRIKYDEHILNIVNRNTHLRFQTSGDISQTHINVAVRVGEALETVQCSGKGPKKFN